MRSLFTLASVSWMCLASSADLSGDEALFQDDGLHLLQMARRSVGSTEEQKTDELATESEETEAAYFGNAHWGPAPQRPAEPEEPDRVEVLIGRSGGNRRCVNAPGPVQCASNAGDRGIRINGDHRGARDRFDIDVDGNQVCARRLDSGGGWGMHLRIACREAGPPPPPTVNVQIGRSRSNRRCVNAPGPVQCAVNAGDRGKRINSDHRNARDSFEVAVEGNQVCARRTDSRGGWGMNLKIKCVEGPPPPPPPAEVEVQIGNSRSNTKCIDAPKAVSCDSDAGDRGNRINSDYRNAGDRFDIDVDGTRVCASRLDDPRGWGMNLKISCVEAEDPPPPPPPARVEVQIGRSGGNRRCVDAPGPVSCAEDAGDRGKRINGDHANAGDRFEVVVEGNQVCARRLDSGGGWGMNLRLACVEAVVEPEPEPEVVEVQIGRSGGNRRCVEASDFVACDTDAGDQGERINPDYRSAGDAFEITVEGKQVCARRLDSGGGWGMNLRIACVATDPPPPPPPPPPPAKVDVFIGRSGGNRRCVNAPGPVACAQNAGDRGIRINGDHSGARDSFDIQVEGNQVCARRTDSRGGWGMNLRIQCTEAPEPEVEEEPEVEPPPPPAKVRVNIGRSRSNRRCVNAPGPVNCAVNAGDRGNRVNGDHVNARDAFEIAVEGNQVCAKRLDSGGGWGMNLQIECTEAAEVPPPPPPAVEVQIGSSNGNVKCVAAPGPVSCDADAGDQGNRINPDYRNAGDRFDIDVEDGQVCAKRLDSGGGWGMNLKITCVEAEEPPPPPPPAKVEVQIGNSRSNRKCVDAPGPVACAMDAGDRGKRVNPDYRNAGDSFEVVVAGGQVCARRLDRRDLGWGMNLRIACVEAEVEPEPEPPVVEVQIGNSRGNKKCVEASDFVACDSDAGDRGERINPDYRSAGDRFDIVVDGKQVCAQRLDRPDLGWGMNLRIACVQTEPPPPPPPPPPPAKVEVFIGRSGGNRRCVNAPGPVACAKNAGDRGIRINGDHRGAGDRFDVVVEGNQVCARRLDSGGGWGMQLKIECVEAEAAPEKEEEDAPPPKVEVNIGRSGGNRKCVNAPGPVNCAVSAGNRGIRINGDHVNAGDTFEVVVEGLQVCARRLDSGGGWGMNLKIACAEAEEVPPPPPARVEVQIGRSGGNRRCVDAPGPVACDSDAGDRGVRINGDHRNAGDTFEVVVEGNQVCARRLDSGGGWGMNLRIACVEAAEPPPPPPPAKVQVNIGNSRSNRKCVAAPSPVVCAGNAGDRGKRVNSDYRNAGDTFEVVVEDGQVCARRLDRRDLGWGMNLQISCVEAPPPVQVDVQIGSSRSNTKCVDAPGPVACEVNAGDRGIRINSDYAAAGDRFNVVADGSQVCVNRLDRPDLGWGMNLAIRCVEAPPPPPPAKVEVQIGSSRTNTRCVETPGPVACDTDAGDRGNRINSDYRNAGDRFNVAVNGAQVCARRLDSGGGWGMNLAISCVEAQAPPPPPPAPEPEAPDYAYSYYASYYYYQ